MAVGEPHPQSLALGATPVGAGHVGGRPGFIDEDETLRVEIELIIEPTLALAQDIGVILLGRVASLFCA
jgi:hypothetical protein